MDRKPSRRSYGRSNSRYQKTCKEKCKDFIRHFIAFMFTNVGIIGLVVGYTIAGAFMFIAIEGSDGESLTGNVETLRNTTVDEIWDLTCCRVNLFNETTWRNHVNATLIQYQRTFIDVVRKGYDPNYADAWSFSGAFLYSLTVITTIGYGNVAPRSEWGKGATIVYAIVGMPLFLLYLSNIGDILAKSFKWIYTRVCLCKGCPGTEGFRKKRVQQAIKQQQKQDIQLSKMQPSVDRFSTQRDWQLDEVQRKSGPKAASASETEDEDSDDEESEEEDDDDKDGDNESEYDPQAVTVPITVCLTVMVGYVCGGALLFKEKEEWEFLDSSYFCFISLSTIGFGDLVPGASVYKSEAIQISFILTAVYLMLGMALIAMCFNLMQEEVIHKTRSLIKKIKAIFYCCIRRKNQPER